MSGEAGGGEEEGVSLLVAGGWRCDCGERQGKRSGVDCNAPGQMRMGTRVGELRAPPGGCPAGNALNGGGISAGRRARIPWRARESRLFARSFGQQPTDIYAIWWEEDGRFDTWRAQRGRGHMCGLACFHVPYPRRTIEVRFYPALPLPRICAESVTSGSGGSGSSGSGCMDRNAGIWMSRITVR